MALREQMENKSLELMQAESLPGMIAPFPQRVCWRWSILCLRKFTLAIYNKTLGDWKEDLRLFGFKSLSVCRIYYIWYFIKQLVNISYNYWYYYWNYCWNCKCLSCRMLVLFIREMVIILKLKKMYWAENQLQNVRTCYVNGGMLRSVIKETLLCVL